MNIQFQSATPGIFRGNERPINKIVPINQNHLHNFSSTQKLRPKEDFSFKKDSIFLALGQSNSQIIKGIDKRKRTSKNQASPQRLKNSIRKLPINQITKPDYNIFSSAEQQNNSFSGQLKSISNQMALHKTVKSKQISQDENTSQGSNLRFASQPRGFSYHPYTLQQYQIMQYKEYYQLGGLGPNIGSEQ